jgi:hypothetical protein
MSELLPELAAHLRFGRHDFVAAAADRCFISWPPAGGERGRGPRR